MPVSGAESAKPRRQERSEPATVAINAEQATEAVYPAEENQVAKRVAAAIEGVAAAGLQLPAACRALELAAADWKIQ